MIALSLALIVRRDVGAGLLPTRAGRSRAAPFLTRPLGLALRLQRGPMLWWAIGMGAFGAAIGGLATEAEQTLEALEIYAEYFAAATGEPAAFARVLGAMLAYAPAVWLLPALAFALFGVAARWMGVVWGGLAWILTVGLLGPLLGLPDVMRDWTPFAHMPQMPSQPFEVAPLLVMAVAVVVMVVVGFAGFRRRDVDVR